PMEKVLATAFMAMLRMTGESPFWSGRRCHCGARRAWPWIPAGTGRCADGGGRLFHGRSAPRRRRRIISAPADPGMNRPTAATGRDFLQGRPGGGRWYDSRLFPRGAPAMPVSSCRSARRPRLLRRARAALSLAALVLASSVAAQPAADAGYRVPVPALQAIVDAPRAPQLILGPKRDLAALWQSPDLPGIDVVAQPELKLAGLRIHPRVHAPSAFSLGADLWLMDVATGSERRISGLPQPLGMASVAWSPDQRWLAFNRLDRASGANELWL